LPTKRHAALSFVFITLLLDMLAFGIIIPVLPTLITKLLHGDIARSSEYLGFFVAVWALMQFFFAPVIGVLSDRIGRRPVILLSNFGLGIDYIIMALAPTIGWLLVGRVLSGITSSSGPTANAYISDITTPETRSRAYGIFGAAFGLGFILGPAAGGWLGHIDVRLPFWTAAGFSLANAVYGFFVLPESLPPERRAAKVQWKKANPVGALRLLRSHHELFGLASVSLLNYLAHEVYVTVFVLYANSRYNWNERDVGNSLAVVGVTTMIVSAGMVGALVKRFGERTTLFLGLFLGGLGFALFGFSPTGWFFVAAIPVNALWGLASPPLQTLMTRRVSVTEQGELQGAVASLRGIAMIIGPGIFSTVFAYYIAPSHFHPGAPWFLSALLLLAALVLAWVVAPKSTTSTEKEPTAPVTIPA
jgi:DHA1 family tetracycline resistance protein-like MFS transporter